MSRPREASSRPDAADRVQTGVRMDRKLVKVLKGLAELRECSLGELLEIITLDAFVGGDPPTFMAGDRAAIDKLASVYGLSIPTAK